MSADDNPKPREQGIEPIPTLSGSIIEFDDDEYGALYGLDTPVRVDLVATREPSDLVRRYLFPTEKFRGEWRRHWIHLLKEVIVITALALLLQSGYRLQVGPLDVDLARIPQADLLSLVGGGLLVLLRCAAWYYNRFVLTQKRVMVVKGLLWRRVPTLSLSSASNIHYTQSVLGRILGYGAFRFSGAYLHPLWRVANLPNPTDLYLQVLEEIYEPAASEARRRPAMVDDGL